MNEESEISLRDLLDYSNYIYTESTGSSKFFKSDVRRNVKRESATISQPSDKFDKYNNKILMKDEK